MVQLLISEIFLASNLKILMPFTSTDAILGPEKQLAAGSRQ